MTTETKQTTIDIGEMDNATELLFTRADYAHTAGLTFEQIAETYPIDALYPKDAAPDYAARIDRFPRYTVRATSWFCIDDTAGQWFAFANVDCFDPPVAIIRARTFETAYDVFCDEFSRWMAVDETDAKDYPEDEREYSASGVHIDASAVQGWPLRLLRVSCA